MKKLVVLAVSIFAFISCSNDNESIQNQSAAVAPKASANKLSAGVNVKLFKAFSAYSEIYGMASIQRQFEVEVRNIAYDKDVSILHKMGDGTWKFFPMKYVKSTSDNTEIWAFSHSGVNFSYFGKEFVVRYKVNGIEYWDNNNGANYSMGTLDGVYLGKDVNILNSGGYVYNGKFDISANLKNLGYTKEVNVVYTTDGWATSHVKPLSYSSRQTVGAQQSVASPNAFGVEFWASFSQITVPSGVQELQYALVYKVNGVEYWDNNFGQNYKATIYN